MRYYITLLFSILLASCATLQQHEFATEAIQDFAWTYADLRTLDLDDSLLPDADMIAAYARYRPGDVQLRVDFLEMLENPGFDMLLALDTQPGGTRELPVDGMTSIDWDILILIPNSGDIQALAPTPKPPHWITKQNMGIRVFRDPVQDNMMIQFRAAGLFETPGKQFNSGNTRRAFTFEVFLADLDGKLIIDRLGPVRSDTQPPRPAPLLLAFWNTYPAYTPATALRRWDGAHTGPLGGRHGLYNLLRTASAAQVPLVLLDLNTPAQLSALDFSCGLELVRNLRKTNQLSLPTSLPPSNIYPEPLTVWGMQSLYQESREIAEGFGVAPSSAIFSPYGIAPMSEWLGSANSDRSTILFVPDEVSSTAKFSPNLEDWIVNPTRWRSYTIIPIPGYDMIAPQDIQPTRDGLSVNTRRALIRTAIIANQYQGLSGNPIIILGGELPASTWGNPEIARAAFNYLVNHPWIRPLREIDLSSIPANNSYIAQASTKEQEHAAISIQAALLEALQRAPDNQLSKNAWQAYMQAYASVYPAPSELAALRAHYQKWTWTLLGAADWAEQPEPLATCEQDIDRDGERECILASETVYAVFEINSGSLSHLFILDPKSQEAHQITGPSSQVVSGMSEASTWDLSRGLVADPGVIPGSFIETDILYNLELIQDQLIFRSLDGNLKKSYSLGERSIRVEYQFQTGSQPVMTQIALMVDPWVRYTPGWATRYSLDDTRLNLDSQSPTSVEVSTNGIADGYLFNASRSYFTGSEDPNLAYPPGHFLPFPLGMIKIQSQADLFIEIQVHHEDK